MAINFHFEWKYWMTSHTNWIEEKHGANWWKMYWKNVCEHGVGKKNTFKKMQIQNYIIPCLFTWEWLTNSNLELSKWWLWLMEVLKIFRIIF